jgi:hypothetical protein
MLLTVSLNFSCSVRMGMLSETTLSIRSSPTACQGCPTVRVSLSHACGWCPRALPNFPRTKVLFAHIRAGCQPAPQGHLECEHLLGRASRLLPLLQSGAFLFVKQPPYTLIVLHGQASVKGPG